MRRFWLRFQKAINLVQSTADYIRPILARLDRLWDAAGVEPDYRSSMRSTMAPLQARAADSRDVRESLSILALPSLCCEAAGGDRRQAEMVTLAWSLLYTAAHALDSVEDEDIEAGSSPHADRNSIINVATGLIASAGLALSLLEETGVDSAAACAIRNDFYRAGLKMCAGQHADLTQSESTLQQCWHIAEAKSATFFAMACRAAAQLVIDDSARIDLFGQFGYYLGILIQIGDDMEGLWPKAGGRSDLAAQRRGTLPVAYAMHVVPPEQSSRLSQCLETAPVDASAEVEARRQIIESGAALYLTIEAEQRRHLAETALRAAAPPSPARDELLLLLYRVAALGHT